MMKLYGNWPNSEGAPQSRGRLVLHQISASVTSSSHGHEVASAPGFMSHNVAEGIHLISPGWLLPTGRTIS